VSPSPQRVTLEAKTHAGKNKLAKTAALSFKWDGFWTVLEERDTVVFSPRPGPWLLLSPNREHGGMAAQLSRWVHATEDADFVVHSTTGDE